MGKQNPKTKPAPPKKEAVPSAASQSQSPIPKHSKSLLQVFWFLNFFVAIAVTFFLIRSIFRNQYTLKFLFDNAGVSKVMQSIGIFIACILTLHTFSADWLDVVFHKTQNDLYRAHVNCTWNTILWTIVLCGAYIYAQDKVFTHNTYLIQLIDLFLLSRIVFSIGYTVGAGIGIQSFRATGFGLTFGPILVILAQAFGHSITWIFK